MPDNQQNKPRIPIPTNNPAAPSDRPQPSREEIERCMYEIMRDPAATAQEMIQLRKHQEQMQDNCSKAAKAVGEMEKMLHELVRPKAVLYQLERIYFDDEGNPCALVNINGQQRELPVAEHVDPEVLKRLKPWEYVKVHPTELIVVGVENDQSLYARAQGEIVTFKRYINKNMGLIVVSRLGHEEQVVTLPDALRNENLDVSSRLVLHRDNPRLVIDVVPNEQTESKYEIPIDRFTTQLEDLAGLDDIISPIMEAWILRLVRKDIYSAFALEPLNGMLLSSYKAGMGKTALVRAMTRWLWELGRRKGFDVVFYNIEPNGLKSMWWGEDSRIVRDELGGTLRARLNQPREQPLIIFVLFDEVESLGRRTGGNDMRSYSGANNDAVQSLLALMDGIVPLKSSQGPSADVVWCGLTNRPDMVDPALKRPERMGGLTLEMPDYDAQSAADIMQIYACGRTIPWYIDEEIRQGVSEHEVHSRIITPAVAQVFPQPMLRYATEGRQMVDVTAGQILTGAHYMNAMNQAKRQAATRALRRVGTAAVGFEDVADCLLKEAHAVARQLDADRQMLQQHLNLRIPVLRTQLVPLDELQQHHFIRQAVS
jgi:SpoVK/Ycf46/Vps4 family AAA+-type ATPase